jgi:hypothetical protein
MPGRMGDRATVRVRDKDFEERLAKQKKRAIKQEEQKQSTKKRKQDLTSVLGNNQKRYDFQNLI